MGPDCALKYFSILSFALLVWLASFRKMDSFFLFLPKLSFHISRLLKVIPSCVASSTSVRCMPLKVTVTVLCPGVSVNKVVLDYPVYPYVRPTHLAMLITDMRLVESCWWQLWNLRLIIKQFLV